MPSKDTKSKSSSAKKEKKAPKAPAATNAKDAMNSFKMEAAKEVGVSLSDGYNGQLTSKQAGSIGGQMVKKMIESYTKNMK